MGRMDPEKTSDGAAFQLEENTEAASGIEAQGLARKGTPAAKNESVEELSGTACEFRAAKQVVQRNRSLLFSRHLR